MLDVFDGILAARLCGSGSSPPEPVLTEKTVTANGTYNAEDDNADGYSSVDVEVPASVLTTKTVTANGTYNASSDNADGYSVVTVNVPTSKLYDPANAMLGYELDTSGGGMHESNKGFVSDWIDVEGVSLIYIYREGSWTYGYFYNENKTPISIISGDVSGRFSVPSGAKYMRFNDQINMVNADNVVKVK